MSGYEEWIIMDEERVGWRNVKPRNHGWQWMKKNIMCSWVKPGNPVSEWHWFLNHLLNYGKKFLKMIRNFYFNIKL